MIIPTAGRLVLQKIKEEEKPQGLLIVPNQRPEQDRYRVVRLPDFLCELPRAPQEGDVVYVDKYKGVEITHKAQVYLVVCDDDVVAYEAGGHSNVSLGSCAEQ